ncbi:MAG TPA: VanZ family protein [Lacisediminihabitans sp.]|uniref:VanZ family protein n=1 Tax=Lacisediminihabitans sp. TaxID=2787631 RepID=UPI002EDA9F22
MFRRHPLLSLVTVAYLGFVGWLTLGPQPLQGHSGVWLWRLLGFFGRHQSTNWLTYSRVEFLANVLLFVPIGMFFLLLFGRRWWFVSVLAGVAMTFAIEIAQLAVPGRVTDIRDIVANSAGTVVGVAVALVLTAGRARRMRRARRPGLAAR